MDLFIHDPELTFDPLEKRAAVQLDEDPGTWPRQILTELYRTLPAVSEYSPRVMLLQVDSEQGVALGAVIISSATNSALSAVRAGNVPEAIVPVIIRSHELQPLDLIMTRSGKMVPLNERRLREVLFRPETFEMITDDWGDTTLWNLFYPPGRTDNTYGAGIGQSIGGGTQGAVTLIQGPGLKISSAEYPMLHQVGPSLLKSHMDEVAAEFTPAVESKLASNPAFFGGVQALQQYEKSASVGRALIEKVAELAPLHVIQIGYDNDLEKYWLKTASRDAVAMRAMEPRYMDRGQLLKIADAALVQKVDTEGSVTITPAGVATPADTSASKWAVVDEPGIYKVQTDTGKQLTGWVIPNLLDFEGNRLPMSVFTNGSAAAIQDQILGARVSTGVDLPASPPKPGRTGVFYSAGQGGVEATVPLKIVGGAAEMDGSDAFIVESIVGESARVVVVPGLKAMVARGGEFFVPVSARFLPLEEDAPVALLSSLGEMANVGEKMASTQPRITLFPGGMDAVSVRYENAPKLASVFDTDLSADQAVFMLCLAGKDADEAITKVARAMDGDNVFVSGAVDITLLSDLANEAREKVSQDSQAVTGLRRLMIKEAATLPSPLTVDAVLSLGFVNSENVRTFVSRIPYMEKALSQICELTLASRLGLTEIPEYASARAARGLDDVIDGLRALSLREVDEEAQA